MVKINAPAPSDVKNSAPSSIEKMLTATNLGAFKDWYKCKKIYGKTVKPYGSHGESGLEYDLQMVGMDDMLPPRSTHWDRHGSQQMNWPEMDATF